MPLVSVVALAAVLIAAGGDSAPETEADDGLDVYFRDVDLMALSDPELAEYSDVEPGEAGVFEESWVGAPPQIPHSVEDLLPIASDDNACLDCHSGDDEDVVAVPESHFLMAQVSNEEAETGMRVTIEGYEASETVAGSRYNCVLCHTPQALNVSEPENEFESEK